MPGDSAIKELNLRLGPGKVKVAALESSYPGDAGQLSSLSERAERRSRAHLSSLPEKIHERSETKSSESSTGGIKEQCTLALCGCLYVCV